MARDSDQDHDDADELGPAAAPIVVVDDADGTTHWELNLGRNEREVIAHLLGELTELLAHGDADRPPLIRLFPPVYLDDEEKEAEYRRLMRDELVTSRRAHIEAASELLRPDGPDQLTEAQVMSLLQSVNAVRVVLGTILDVTDDEPFDAADDRAGDDDAHAAQLYDFLSWLLEWVVRSLDA